MFFIFDSAQNKPISPHYLNSQNSETTPYFYHSFEYAKEAAKSIAVSLKVPISSFIIKKD